MKPPKTVAEYIQFCRDVCKNAGWIVVRRHGQFGYYDPESTEYNNMYFHNLKVMFPGHSDYDAEDLWKAEAKQNWADIDIATSGMRSDSERVRWIRHVLRFCLQPKSVR